MAFNAGSVEATLTLNRDPFQAGLRLARAEAQKFARERFEVKVTPRLDQDALSRIRTTLNRTVGRVTLRPVLDRDAFNRIRTTLNRTVGRVVIRPQLDNVALSAIRERIERVATTIRVRLVVPSDELAQLRARIELMRPVISVRLEYDRDTLDQLIARLNAAGGAADRGSRSFDNFGNSGHRAFSRVHGVARLVIATLPLLLPAAGAAITGVLGLLGAMTAALVTAVVGVGAFAAVAIPAFTRVKDAVAAGQAEIDKLPDGLRQAATAMQNLNKEYSALVERTQTPVGFAMAAGFNAATVAVKTLDPIVVSAARAFQLIGEMAARYFGSPHWQAFVQLMAANMVPILTKLFEIIAYGTRIVMNLTTAFMPMAQGLLTDIVSGLANMADQTGRLADDPRFAAWVETAKESLRRFWEFLVAVIRFIFEFSYALAPLGTAVFNVLSMVFNALSKMPPEWLNGIAIGLSAIFTALLFGASGPVALAAGVILGIAAALGTLYSENEKIRTSVDNVVRVLRDNFLPIWDTLTNNFRQHILPVFNTLMDTIDREFRPILDKIWPIIRDQVIPAFGGMADTVTQKLIPAVLNFLNAAAPFVAWLVNLASDEILGTVKFVFQVLDGLFQGLAGTLKIITAAMTGDWDLFWLGMKDIGEGALKVIGSIFGLNLQEMKDVFAEWGRQTQNQWANNWGGIITEQDGSQRVVNGSWNDFWNEMGRVFGVWGMEISNNWVNYWGGMRTEQDGSQTRVNGSWNDFWNRNAETYNAWAASVNKGWYDFWGEVGRVLGDWINSITNTWSVFWSDLGRIFTDWWGRMTRDWNNFWGEVGRITNQAVDNIGAAFRRIGNFFRDPIQWVIDVVLNNGILKGWNTVMGWIGQPALKATPIAPLPRFREGGPIHGGVPGRDSVPIMTMPGEYVLSKRAISNMGGLSKVDQMHKSARRGSLAGLGVNRSDGLARQALMRTVPLMDDGNLRGFAYGGVQPHVARAGQEIERLFGRMPGGIGGVGSRGNVSDHPSGHALDFMTLRDTGLGNRISNHFLANAQRMLMKYIIWQQRINQGSGWRMMPDRGSPTANHMDHPHVSFLRIGQGGRPFSGGGDAPVQSTMWDIFGQRVRDLFGGIFNAGQMPIGGPIGDAAKSIPPALIGKVIEAAQAKLTALFSGVAEFVGNVGSAANVARWTPTVISALVRTGNNPLTQVPMVLRRLGQESGGNPNAINNWDSNAKRGTPSKGLMQVIDPTFQAHRDRGLPNNIWDPLANIVASMRYAKSRYGSLEAAYNRAGGYATGGLLQPNQVGYNETGRPERVLNPTQTQDFDELLRLLRIFISSGGMQGLAGGGGNNYYLTVPQGSSAQEMLQEIEFRSKNARLMGVHSR